MFKDAGKNPHVSTINEQKGNQHNSLKQLQVGNAKKAPKSQIKMEWQMIPSCFHKSSLKQPLHSFQVFNSILNHVVTYYVFISL